MSEKPRRLGNKESNKITRECVETALIQLMKTKPFEAITITDIVQRAGVSRQAYYRNYNSKEDILTDIFNRCVDTIMDSIRIPREADDACEVYRRLFTMVRSNADLFQIIIKANLESMFRHAVNDNLIAQIEPGNKQEIYQTYSFIGSTVNVLFAWIGSGMEESVEEMADICAKNLISVLN